MFAALFRVLHTGVPWRDPRERFGPWGSVCTRFRRRCTRELFARRLAAVAQGSKGKLRYIGGSPIKLHQHGASPRGGEAAQAIGRTNEGINTRLAAIVERGGRAVALGLAEGQRHDPFAVESLLGGLRQRCVVGDKGFDADNFRARLRRQHPRVCIPPKSSRRCPATFHRGDYRCRHKIENVFCRINGHRRTGTRFEKPAITFPAFVQFAAVLDWLTHRF